MVAARWTLQVQAHGVRRCVAALCILPPIAVGWYERHANLIRAPFGRELELFLLLGRGCCADQFSRAPGRPQLGIIQDRACALYALYRTHNFASHRRGVGDLSGAFVAYLREARIASAILD